MGIEFKDIVQIQRLEIELFEVLDDDYVDNRVVRAKERAIYNRLDKITDDVELKTKIRLAIQQGNWDAKDNTYKPICDKLRDLGFQIIKE